MNIIEEFKKYDPNLPDTLAYLATHGLGGELDRILTTTKGEALCSELFAFGVRYGVLPIVKFLYEEVNYPFDVALLTGFVPVAPAPHQDGPHGPLVATVSDGGAGGEPGTLKFSVEDRYSRGRNECIEYLTQMKKYSQYFSKDRRFWYRYRKDRYG